MRRRHQQLNFAGSLHFVTTVTRTRGRWFVDEVICIQILSLFEKYRAQYEVDCFGYVLMPDHLHVLLSQSNDGSSVINLMNSFKRETSKQLELPHYHDNALWCDRYDDVPLPGPRAAMQRLMYMHGNPVKSGLADIETDYLWSSARLYFEIETTSLITVVRV